MRPTVDLAGPENGKGSGTAAAPEVLEGTAGMAAGEEETQLKSITLGGLSDLEAGPSRRATAMATGRAAKDPTLALERRR